MGNYKGYTPAQSKAHNNYIAKFARLEVRTTMEQRGAIQAHAAAQGESVNGFINRAIQEAMERDNTAPATSERRTEGSKEGGRTMLNDKQVQEVILATLKDLRQVIKASSRETYTRDELLQLLEQVATTMTELSAEEE